MGARLLFVDSSKSDSVTVVPVAAAEGSSNLSTDRVKDDPSALSNATM
jgi:hypothetical protein